jgi:hypothetical protein
MMLLSTICDTDHRKPARFNVQDLYVLRIFSWESIDDPNFKPCDPYELMVYNVLRDKGNVTKEKFVHFLSQGTYPIRDALCILRTYHPEVFTLLNKEPDVNSKQYKNLMKALVPHEWVAPKKYNFVLHDTYHFNTLLKSLEIWMRCLKKFEDHQ